jgi:hypothetical protein
MSAYAPIHPERPRRRTAVAFGVSAVAHALLLASLAWGASAAREALARREAERPKEVALAPLDARRWEENRAVASRFVPSAAFDTPASDLRSPERARFLSDRDRRAEHETVAAPSPGAPGAPGTPSERPPVEPPPIPMRSPQPPPEAGDGTGAPATPGPDLRPHPAGKQPLALDLRALGDGGVPEIDGVAVGGLTVLNAEAWRYATFFDRVGETLYGVWRVEFLPRPPPASVAARPHGGLARVAYSVTLDATGRAVAVTVRRSSGLPDVDALLADLLRRSAPFPNLPPGLLDERGQYSDTWILALVWGRQGP